MALRDDLKLYIPKYLWEILNFPEGTTITNEDFNARWNMIRDQGDTHSDVIRDMLQMLYDTLLNDTDGTAHIKVNLPAYATDNLRQVLVLIDERQKADALALANHKTSADHDYRYYTQEQLNSGQLDPRYYTKVDLIPWLRGGDTEIKEEVFTIVNPNLGDGTFTYTSGEDTIVGNLGEEGEQIFELTKGIYEPDKNRLEVYVNDTLRRSMSSGGVEELSNNTFALTSPENGGSEITVRYFDRIGISADYNIKLSPSKPPHNNGKTMWFQIIDEVV